MGRSRPLTTLDIENFYTPQRLRPGDYALAAFCISALTNSQHEPGGPSFALFAKDGVSRNPGGEPTQLVIPPVPRLELPALEDRESIQVALSVILGSLARNELDPKRATTLLYGLQVASANAVRLDHRPSRDYLVTETTTDDTGHELAPDEDPKAEIDYQQFLRDMAEEDQEADEDDDIDEDDGQ